MNHNLGEIPLQDYLQLVGEQPKRRHRIAKILAGALLCVICTAAGDYTGLWTGKNSKNLTFEDAVRFVEDSRSRDFEVESGMMILQREVLRAIDLLGQTAARDDAVGLYASTYLLNVTRPAVARIKELATVGPHVDRQEASLRLLNQDLQR